MNITKKVLLSVLAVGIGGTGYVLGTLTRSQPTKATVEVEPTHTQSVSKAASGSGSKNTQHSAQHPKSANKAHSTDKQTKDSSDTKNKSASKSAKQSQAAANSQINKRPAGQPVKHTTKKLYLTGKKSETEYSSELIKRANQIYKHNSKLSFKECLALARKELN